MGDRTLGLNNKIGTIPNRNYGSGYVLYPAENFFFFNRSEVTRQYMKLQ